MRALTVSLGFIARNLTYVSSRNQAAIRVPKPPSLREVARVSVTEGVAKVLSMCSRKVFKYTATRCTPSVATRQLPLGGSLILG